MGIETYIKWLLFLLRLDGGGWLVVRHGDSKWKGNCKILEPMIQQTTRDSRDQATLDLTCFVGFRRELPGYIRDLNFGQCRKKDFAILSFTLPKCTSPRKRFTALLLRQNHDFDDI